MIRACARDKNCFTSREKSPQSDHWRSSLRLKRLFSLPLSHQNRTAFYVGLRWLCSYTTTSLLSRRSAKAKAVKGAKGGRFSCNQTVLALFPITPTRTSKRRYRPPLKKILTCKRFLANKISLQPSLYRDFYATLHSF